MFLWQYLGMLTVVYWSLEWENGIKPEFIVLCVNLFSLTSVRLVQAGFLGKCHELIHTSLEQMKDNRTSFLLFFFLMRFYMQTKLCCLSCHSTLFSFLSPILLFLILFHFLVWSQTFWSWFTKMFYNKKTKNKLWLLLKLWMFIQKKPTMQPLNICIYSA